MLLALVHQQRDQLRVASALRATIPVQFCHPGEAVQRAANARVFLTELADANGASLGALLGAIRSRNPLLPILLYLDLSVKGVRALENVMDIRPQQLIIRGVDDVAERLPATITRVLEHSCEVDVLAAVYALLPPEHHAALQAGFAAAGQPLTVPVFAATLHLPVRTLHGRLARGGLPTAQELIGWLRFLRVACVLADPITTVEAAATKLGFASASSVYALARRVTGLPLPSLRQRGILATALETFAARVRASAGTRMPSP